MPVRLPHGGADLAGAGMRRLLVVDDQAYVRSFCRIALERQGHGCDEAEDGHFLFPASRPNALRGRKSTRR